MRRAIPAFSFAVLCFSQPPTAPVVSPRGVVNAFTQLPAPSRVTPGGIIRINGLNLGPAEGAKAPGLPLPLELAGIRVMVNARQAPLVSVSPNRIVAQVPWEVPVGTANIIVQRDGQASKVARINIVAAEPAVRATSDAGFGEAARTTDGSTMTLSATGLGVTQPRATTGDAGPVDAALNVPVRVYVGGIPADSITALSADRPGEFDIQVTVPDGAAAGDLINVVAGNVAASPRRLFKSVDNAVVKYLPVPRGTPELRSLVGSDLRGEFLMAAGARGTDGCYAAFRIDFAAMKINADEPCLTTGNANAPNPFTVTPEGNALAALLGPPAGEAPNGVSSKVVVFNPQLAASLKAELPSLATNVAGANGNFRAALTGTDPAAVTIDANTAEVAPAQGGGGAGGGFPGAGGGGGAAAGCLNPNLTVDLGDGLTRILSCTQVGQGFLSVIGDSEDAPTKAKLATMSPQGVVQASVDFPPSVLPLVLPAQQLPGGGVALPPGVGGLLNRLRVTAFADGTTFYVVSRLKDGSRDALSAFAGQQAAVVVPFPVGWFAASCTPQLRIATLDLARQLAISATKTLEKDAKTTCLSYGFAVLDRDAKTISISESPGRDGYNAASQFGDLSDYVYSVSTNAQRPNVAETLYILDGSNGSSYRLDLPSGVLGFGAIREEPSILALLAPANATATGNGDAGIAVFDIESASSRVLPTPDGFANVAILQIYDTTRKILARGTKAGNAGTALLIYDLVTGDLYMPPNPDGCAFVGAVPAAGQPGQPGVGGQGQQAINLLVPNAKSNTVAAGCYGANRALTGFLYVKVN